VIAHALTGVRLALALPTAVAVARPDLLGPDVLTLALGAAIATDFLDGPVARRLGTASPGGQLFDHATDCLFVTAGLAGAAKAGLVTPILATLVPIAFGQYVFDSYWRSRRRELRASALGRWNGIFYFVPLVCVAVLRISPPGMFTSWLTQAIGILAYVLVATTVVSMIDRATARSTGNRAANGA
jgi:CDP-diacylglycerol--glycerol-3-phosphate 3-phosphatidyltransferase